MSLEAGELGGGVDFPTLTGQPSTHTAVSQVALLVENAVGGEVYPEDVRAEIESVEVAAIALRQELRIRFGVDSNPGQRPLINFVKEGSGISCEVTEILYPRDRSVRALSSMGEWRVVIHERGKSQLVEMRLVDIVGGQEAQKLADKFFVAFDWNKIPRGLEREMP